MKPIAIFRFSEREGPGYFLDFLNAREIPSNLIKIDQGEEVPSDVGMYSGICLMGGPMSVNDPLPWIKYVCGLLRQAFVKDIPMIGHCLGGQLISRSLGGKVQPNRVKEIGWSELFPARLPEAKEWFGELATKPFGVFQWHGETFSVPMQAKLIAINSYCRNQIFSFGPHLAMQCHVEMTFEMIQSWCEKWDEEQLKESETVQSKSEIIELAEQRLPALRQLADSLYSNWLAGVEKRL